jgi:acyl carrier protein
MAQVAPDAAEAAMEMTGPQSAATFASASALAAAPAAAVGQDDVRTMIAGLPASERQAAALALVRQEVARVLRLPAGELPGARDRLMDLGVDSLMAVELRNRLEQRAAVPGLPVTLIFDYPTPAAIGALLLERVEQPLAGTNPEEVPQPAQLTADEIAALPEEDVAALLRSRLSR